ncbi:hypothetical protein [Chryseobacterium piperi]|uniref:hypothetical protein n=1 Tax=Chryseobacterium piperi TaxID=558152 RepID=UPI000ADC73CF|nr:hypothetical protein [Chryseobacterium piperi]
MKKANFNAKEFLKVKDLSPLEQNQLRGGFGEQDDNNMQVRRQQVQQPKQVVVVVVQR